MRYLLIYCTGFAVLITAILANVVANMFGLATWYDVLNGSDFALNILDIVWLMVLYPFILGLGAVGFDKIWSMVKSKYTNPKNGTK